MCKKYYHLIEDLICRLTHKSLKSIQDTADRGLSKMHSLFPAPGSAVEMKGLVALFLDEVKKYL